MASTISAIAGLPAEMPKWQGNKIYNWSTADDNQIDTNGGITRSPFLRINQDNAPLVLALVSHWRNGLRSLFWWISSDCVLAFSIKRSWPQISHNGRPINTCHYGAALHYCQLIVWLSYRWPALPYQFPYLNGRSCPVSFTDKKNRGFRVWLNVLAEVDGNTAVNVTEMCHERATNVQPMLHLIQY